MFGAVYAPQQGLLATRTAPVNFSGTEQSCCFAIELFWRPSRCPRCLLVPTIKQFRDGFCPRRGSMTCDQSAGATRPTPWSRRSGRLLHALHFWQAVVDKDASSAERPLRWSTDSVSPPPPTARQWIAQPKPTNAESEYTDKAPLFARVVRSHCFALPWAALTEVQSQAADNEDLLLAALASASPRASIYRGHVPSEPYPRTFAKDGLVLETGKSSSAECRRKETHTPALITASRQAPLGVLIDPNDDAAVPVFVAARYPLSGRQRSHQAADVVAIAAIAASPLGIANGLLDVVVDELSAVVRRFHPSIPPTPEHERAIRRSMVAAIGPSPPNAEYGFITIRSDLLNAIFLPWEDRPHVGTTRRCYFVHDIYRDVHSVICRSRRSRTVFTFLAQRRAGRGPGLSNPVPLPDEPLGIRFPVQEWHLRLAPLVYERLRSIGVGQVELTRVSLPRTPVDSEEDTRHFSYIFLE
ncbi:hypothetical protein CCYA_CCYA12G3414 [Cyanidiococcus yangmingshanensis]|nr:hypothetical protein CCYA_CCYA12G3414 [Cyanidiococcus yangmingshanensis]